METSGRTLLTAGLIVAIAGGFVADFRFQVTALMVGIGFCVVGTIRILRQRNTSKSSQMKGADVDMGDDKG